MPQTVAQYAEIARKHWTRYLPVTTGRLGDPEAFFRSLGRQVKDQVLATVQGMPPPATPGEYRMSELQAEEAALRDLVLLDPEPGSETATQDWGGLTPGWVDEEPLRDDALG